MAKYTIEFAGIERTVEAEDERDAKQKFRRDHLEPEFHNSVDIEKREVFDVSLEIKTGSIDVGARSPDEAERAAVQDMKNKIDRAMDGDATAQRDIANMIRENIFATAEEGNYDADMRATIEADEVFE